MDKKNRLISDEICQTGTVDRVEIYPREIVKKALECSAVAVILVHNHPSGDPNPSKEDIKLTDMIIEALKTLGITVHDHIIIAGHKHFSFKENWLISK